jgi:hypothetical protein
MSGGENKVSELLEQSFTPAVESHRTKLTLNSTKGAAEKSLKVITPVVQSTNSLKAPQANVSPTTQVDQSRVLEGRSSAFGPAEKSTEAFEYKNADAIEDTHGQGSNKSGDA